MAVPLGKWASLRLPCAWKSFDKPRGSCEAAGRSASTRSWDRTEGGSPDTGGQPAPGLPAPQSEGWSRLGRLLDASCSRRLPCSISIRVAAGAVHSPPPESMPPPAIGGPPTELHRRTCRPGKSARGSTPQHRRHPAASLLAQGVSSAVSARLRTPVRGGSPKEQRRIGAGPHGRGDGPRRRMWTAI